MKISNLIHLPLTISDVINSAFSLDSEKSSCNCFVPFLFASREQKWAGSLSTAAPGGPLDSGPLACGNCYLLNTV